MLLLMLIILKLNIYAFKFINIFSFFFVGSGIFVSPSGLLARTGSVGVSFIIWLACGVLSLMGKSIFKQNKQTQTETETHTTLYSHANLITFLQMQRHPPHNP